MYSRIGGKIKVLAIALAELFAIAAILGGVYFLKNGGKIWIGLAFILVGPFLAWVLSFPLYGFGDLVSNSDKIKTMLEEYLRGEGEKTEAQLVQQGANRDVGREALYQLLHTGRITEEEYRTLMESMNN